MATYGAAKAQLFAWPGLEAAVVNLDDAFGRELARRAAGRRDAHRLSARAATRTRRCAPTTSRFDDARHRVRSARRRPVASRAARRCSAASTSTTCSRSPACCARWADAPAQVARRSRALQPIHGRMNRLGGDGGAPLVVVDYAHTPDALEQALPRCARTRRPADLRVRLRRRSRRGKRPQMAAIAERLRRRRRSSPTTTRAARTATRSSPRSSPASRMPDARTVRARPRARRSRGGRARPAPDDIVLIAGKGHEPYQEIARRASTRSTTPRSRARRWRRGHA